MKRYIKSALAPAAALLISLASTSCLNDLDKEPISPKIDLNVNNDGLLNKCYANFGINGNGSGSNSDDDPDVKGFNDPGMTGLVRAMFNMNELPTDEATCSWGDGLQELNSAKFDPSHAWVKLYYHASLWASRSATSISKLQAARTSRRQQSAASSALCSTTCLWMLTEMSVSLHHSRNRKEWSAQNSTSGS